MGMSSFFYHTFFKSTRATLFLRVALVLFLFVFIFVACNNSKPPIADKTAEAQEGYSMYTTHVNLAVSDSGVTQYRIIAQDWYIYNNGENARWYFPHKFKAIEVDSVNRTKASLVADTAYYYTRKSQWHFIGHVKVENTVGDTFLAKHLIWDSETRLVSSEDSVTVISNERNLTGTSFRASQDFSWYVFLNNRGSAVVNDNDAGDTQHSPITHTEPVKNTQQ